MPFSAGCPPLSRWSPSGIFWHSCDYIQLRRRFRGGFYSSHHSRPTYHHWITLQATVGRHKNVSRFHEIAVTHNERQIPSVRRLTVFEQLKDITYAIRFKMAFIQNSNRRSITRLSCCSWDTTRKADEEEDECRFKLVPPWNYFRGLLSYHSQDDNRH